MKHLYTVRTWCTGHRKIGDDMYAVTNMGRFDPGDIVLIPSLDTRQSFFGHIYAHALTPHGKFWISMDNLKLV
jgi:hypothetical protein